MKSRLPIAVCIGCLLVGGGLASSSAYEITAPELASFLGISAWATKVDLPPGTYTLDISPIENGRIQPSLIQGQIDWSQDPDGLFKFIAGPENGNYRISISSKTGGTLGVTTQVPTIKLLYSPALPSTITEGVYVLMGDLQDRDPKLPQNDPSTYKRGFVLKIAKKK